MLRCGRHGRGAGGEGERRGCGGETGHARECERHRRPHHFAAGVAGISAISFRSFGRYSGYEASLKPCVDSYGTPSVSANSRCSVPNGHAGT